MKNSEPKIEFSFNINNTDTLDRWEDIKSRSVTSKIGHTFPWLDSYDFLSY